MFARLPGRLVWLWFGVASCATVLAQRPPSPFGVTASMETAEGQAVVQFKFTVPREHVLYSARLHFETGDGTVLTPSKIPAPILVHDEVSGQEKSVYDHAFAAELKLGAPLPESVVVKFQGCSNSACYFPESHIFDLQGGTILPRTDRAVAAKEDGEKAAGNFTQAWQADAATFKVISRQTGYVPANDFLEFLTNAKQGRGSGDGLLGRYHDVGLAATLLLILAGGIGLNLTPCVLPLIPINLAIIGAGARARSRGRGFALGAVYGAGMALAYGALGLGVVLTGSKFGALNSSVWFNVAIALIFIAMGLAMFDFVNIDLSRFQTGGGTKAAGQGGQFVIAFSAGLVASLLAGACVAPVVISVLLLATQLYSQGAIAGLLLPFLLGLGMALPWPFAGAGLSLLPPPGKWMKRVKQGFGVLIFLFAVYYGHLGWNLFQNQQQMLGVAAAYAGSNPQGVSVNAALAEALEQSRKEGKPLFIDFAASWCKNCIAMDHTVFNTPQVKQRLKDFVVVQYLAEQPNQSPARQALDYFGVIGLPTYVVLMPPK